MSKHDPNKPKPPKKQEPTKTPAQPAPTPDRKHGTDRRDG